MAKGFPYFKFIATEWLTGDIVYEELSVQGLFINLCAVYWQREGKLSIEDINRRYKNAPELAVLNGRYFSVTDGFISIKFLDEQFEDVAYISETNSRNGQKGGRPKVIKLPTGDNPPLNEINPPLNDGLPTDNQPDNGIKPPPSEKKQRRSKEDIKKNKEDNTKLLKQHERPSLAEYLDYCKTLLNGKYQLYEFALTGKYNAWVDNDWKDGHDNPIKSWKAKIQNTVPYLGTMTVDVPHRALATVPVYRTEEEKRAAMDAFENE